MNASHQVLLNDHNHPVVTGKVKSTKNNQTSKRGLGSDINKKSVRNPRKQAQVQAKVKNNATFPTRNQKPSHFTQNSQYTKRTNLDRNQISPRLQNSNNPYQTQNSQKYDIPKILNCILVEGSRPFPRVSILHDETGEHNSIEQFEQYVEQQFKVQTSGRPRSNVRKLYTILGRELRSLSDLTRGIVQNNLDCSEIGKNAPTYLLCTVGAVNGR